jgi:hypothetical protein
MTGLLVATALTMAGTWLGYPTLSPIVAGLAVGGLWPKRAVRVSALAGVLAWGLFLAAAQVRGADLVDFGVKLGGAMSLPGWAPFVATLLYPAILAASAAWIGILVSPRRETVSRAALYR